MTSQSYSQVVFQITNNACDPSTEQAYNFEEGNGAGWNTPNLLDTSNAIRGCLVLVNDGTTPGNIDTGGNTPHPTISDACDSTTWTQDLTGKIAVFYRGACEYGLKAYNAQKRGAIGAICINHTGAASGMAGGTYGVNVTIPTIMIGETDGNNLVACLDTVCTNVEGYIGLEEYLINNDNLASNKSMILMTESSAMPWDLARNGTEYPIDLGLWIYNKGLSAQTGITATVDIEYGGTIVYTNTSSSLNFSAPDTTYLDTQYVDLGTYAPVLWIVGTYTIIYTINNVGEQDTTDNQFSFEFKLTNNDDIYAKSRLNNMNEPLGVSYYTYTESLQKEDWKTCISFKNSYAGTRNANAIGMTFSASPAGSTMVNEDVEIIAYRWDDSFTDIYTATFDTLIQLSNGFHTYINELDSGKNIYISFDTPIPLIDNQKYLFCIYNESTLGLRIGFDNLIDYTSTVNHYMNPISPSNSINWSAIESWYPAGIDYNYIPAISVTMDIATSINENNTDLDIIPYPNPVTNLLTIPFRKQIKGSVEIALYDNTGKLVLLENKTINNDKIKLDVSSIANGYYVFQLTYSDNSKDSFKISVNR